MLQRDAQALCLVCESDHVAAGLAKHVLGHAHAVTGPALVGVHSKAMLADAMHFGVEVADAHFLGLAGGQGLTVLQSAEHTERLGFRIDKFHSFTFLSKVAVLFLQRVIIITASSRKIY